MLRLLVVAIVAVLVAESIQKLADPTGKPVTSKPGLGKLPEELLKPECWTRWYDRDNPSGTADWESLKDLRKDYPGKICPNPSDIEVVTLSGKTVGQTGEVIYKMDTTSGFICRNEDQPDGICEDYKVRFSCSLPYCDDGVCWTKWLDRDNPSGTGDWELLKLLRTKYDICENPLYIEVVTTGFPTPANNINQKFHVFNPTEGFVCRNQDQKSGICKDYKVRFGCKC